MVNNTYTLIDFHKAYISKGGKLNKKDFKSIIKTFLQHAVKGVLAGKPLDLGYSLGSIHIGRFERDPSKPTIDWGASNKYKAELIKQGKPLYNNETKEGYEWLIYFTDSYYYRYCWSKKVKAIDNNAILHNAFFYQLHPYAKAKIRLTKSITELSPIIHELIVRK